MKRILKRILPEFLKKYLKKLNRIRICYRIFHRSEKQRNNGKKRVFLILTPQHSNLGDHAIAKAEFEFLKDYDVFEITDFYLSLLLEFPFFVKKIFSDDLIIFSGGGYLGTLWLNVEIDIRKLMNICGSRNSIILFPQTIFYENDEFGHAEFEKSKQIYNKCDNLIIAAREKTSYEIMKNAYKNVYLIPDMVLYLNECKNDCVRNGVQLTLRSDCEKTMTDEYHNNLISFVNSMFDDVRILDMNADYDISPEFRNEELDKRFDEFRLAELVITDRLHGMIFSAVTGTPCIVLNSKSPKVKGVYDWVLKDCEYITFTDDFDEMSEFINRTKGKVFEYDNSCLMPYYDELKQIVKREIASE